MTAPVPPASETEILQTASSLVVLASSTYQSLQDLPVGGGAAAIPVISDHLGQAVTALRQTRADLAAATRDAGGQVQQNPDPVYARVVDQALPTVRSPGDVVGLALTLEDVLAQTLVSDVTALSTPRRRALLAGSATDAAGRKARLLVFAALLDAGSSPLLTAPPNLGALPVGAGTAGFPDARFPTDKAAPAAEGAL